MLLAILGSLTVGVSPAIATVATTPTYNKDSSPQAAKDIWAVPTSIQAIQEGIEKQFESQQGPQKWSGSMTEKVQLVYDRMYGGKLAPLTILTMDPMDETIDRSFQDVYTNNTPNKQTFQTHSYSQEITNTSTFNVQLRESVSASFSASFIFGSTTIKADLSSTQAWTNTQSVLEIVSAPSQPFVVDPYSRGIASYVIKTGTYNVTTAAHISFPLNTLMFARSIVGSAAGVLYSLKEIISFLNDAGYGNMIRNDSKEFSIITTDNPNNPTSVSLNFPIDYISKGGKMEVEFLQEPLN